MVFQSFECYKNSFSIHSIPFPSQNNIPCEVSVSQTNERRKYNQAKKTALQFPVLSPIPVLSLPDIIGCHAQWETRAAKERADVNGTAAETKQRGMAGGEQRAHTFLDGFDGTAGAAGSVHGFLVSGRSGVRGFLSDHHRFPVLPYVRHGCSLFFFFASFFASV
jgi:hypothetical protein